MPLTCEPHLPKDKQLTGMLKAVHVRQQALCFSSVNKFGCSNITGCTIDHTQAGSTSGYILASDWMKAGSTQSCEFCLSKPQTNVSW